MRLAQRLTLTLVAITVILIAPAAYGLIALRQLQQIAQNLSARDAVGALALGRLQAAFQALDNSQRIYLALGSQPGDSAAAAAAERVASTVQTIELELATLRQRGYAAAASTALERWANLRTAIAEEQRLVEQGNLEQADLHRIERVDPAFLQMDLALDPIGRAINLEGQRQIREAQMIATRAAATTFVALTIALLIALGIGGWTGRNLLRPVTELRRGMSHVAAGDFGEELSIPLDRPDEIGDLARSFTVMAQELATLDRLKAEFVSVASHELKTPLSVIRGYVSLLRDEVYGPVNIEQKKVLNSVGDQTDRLGRLIQQLLDISRFEAGVGRLDVKPIDLRSFLDEFAVSFEALAIQNEIDFVVSIDEQLPQTIEGDGDRLNEVVGNLLANAFKFTPRHGRIELQALPAEDGEGILIEVSDTGGGIPPDQLNRVFEKFYQIESESVPKSAGTGLGLAISKEITEAHGGTIGAESKLGQGTTFRVFLPLRPPEAVRASSTPAPSTG